MHHASGVWEASHLRRRGCIHPVGVPEKPVEAMTALSYFSQRCLPYGAQSVAATVIRRRDAGSPPPPLDARRRPLIPDWYAGAVLVLLSLLLDCTQ